MNNSLFRVSIRKVTVLLAGLGIFGALSFVLTASEDTKHGNDEHKVTKVEKAPFGNVISGKAASTACAACHSSDGNSANAEWPNLAGQNAEYTYTQLKLIQSGKRSAPLMVGQLDNRSDHELRDIAAYFAAQTPKLGAKLDKNLATLGESVYRGGNRESGVPACSACHGVMATGIPMSNYPRLEGQQPKYLVKALNDFAQGKRTGTAKQKIMKEVASLMTEEEIEAVSAYIHALK